MKFVSALPFSFAAAHRAMVGELNGVNGLAEPVV